MTLFVHFFETIRKTTGFKAHHLETIIALLILSTVALISGKGWVEWIGVFGVALTFEYQVLSTYLREYADAAEKHKTKHRTSAVSREIQVIYYLKELVWIAYFIFLGAYSALVGTILFILYGIWRKMYRNAVPLNKADMLL